MEFRILQIHYLLTLLHCVETGSIASKTKRVHRKSCLEILILEKLREMPYTKSGIFYTAKPAPVGGIVARRAAYQANRPAPKFMGTRKGYKTVPRTMGVYGAGEMKYFDTERTSTAVPVSLTWANSEFQPNVGTPTTLLCPTVGSAINQRIARKVKVYKIRVKGLITVAPLANQTAGPAAQTVRILLVRDKQTNAAQAQGEEIIAAPTTGSALHAVSAFQSLANLGRFDVLKDKTLTIQGPQLSYDGTNIESAGLSRPFKMTHKYSKPIEVSFNAVNGGTIADVVNDSWCVYANSTNNDLAAAILYQARVYYKE